MVSLSPALLEAIEAHAIEGYPNEVCGFVVGAPDPGPLLVVVRAKNVQDEYHARFPDEFVRTARTAYFIEPAEILRTFDSARTEGRVVRVIYHSHADHDAYFSAEDRRAALFGDEPAYPVDYLVVSVRDGSVRGHKLFRWNPSTRDFEEVPLG